jgi:hypothetical protein
LDRPPPMKKDDILWILPIDHGLLAWLRKAVNSGFMWLKFKNVKII